MPRSRSSSSCRTGLRGSSTLCCGDTTFPLHRLAKKYGVQYVIAGHVHEMLHFTLEGIEYVSMVSSGGHLRASGKYEDGWFFGYADRGRSQG